MLRNQRGVVSILTVTFFSILVMIIALGTILAQTKELRQSTDADQSIRSYYAAESGVEQAVFYLSSNNTYKTPPGTCLDNNIIPSLSGTNGLEITCAKVEPNSVKSGATLKQEESTQIDLSGQPSIYRMQLNWNDPGEVPYDDYVPTTGGAHGLYAGSAAILPATGTWGIPALMEVTVYYFPTTNIQPNGVRAKTIYLRPSANGSSVASFMPARPDQVQAVKCEHKTGLSCAVQINNFPPLANPTDPVSYVVRFRPRYHAATYAAEFFNDHNQNITPGGGGVRIDVTARAGDIFRRIVATAGGNAEPLTDGLDYVIFTQQDICKDISVDSATGKVSGLFGTGPNCRQDEDGIGDPDTDE